MCNKNPENGKAYRFTGRDFQELDASEPGDPEARNRILLRAAVLSYVEHSDPGPLTGLFEKGFPLYNYAESRELLIDLISGVPIQSSAESNKQANMQKNRDAEMKAAYYYATLTGPGKSSEEAPGWPPKAFPAASIISERLSGRNFSIGPV